jgi:hypothetical protein
MYHVATAVATEKHARQRKTSILDRFTAVVSALPIRSREEEADDDPSPSPLDVLRVVDLSSSLVSWEQDLSADWEESSSCNTSGGVVGTTVRVDGAASGAPGVDRGAMVLFYLI